MKPSAERSEAMVGGRNEEIGNGKHEKRGGHRWSRRGRRRQSRKWHTEAGINGITPSYNNASRNDVCFAFRSKFDPLFPLNSILPLGVHPLCQTHDTGQVYYALPVSYN